MGTLMSVVNFSEIHLVDVEKKQKKTKTTNVNLMV